MLTLEQAAATREQLRRRHERAELEATRQLVEVIRRDLALGVKATAIARRIGVSRPTLYRMLSEPAYNRSGIP